MKRLRVLVANQRQDRLAEVVDLVANLGHDVIAPQIDVAEVAASRHVNGPMWRSSGSARARSMRSS